MTHISSKSKEKFQYTKTRFLSLLSFVLGFLDAFFIYVISSYFVSVRGNENISGFYLVSFLIIFGLLLNLGVFIGRFGRVRTLYILLFFLVSLSAILATESPSWIGALFLMLFLIVNNIMWVVMDILLESYSADQVSGRIRGFYLTVVNAGFLLAPWLATRTLDIWGYSGIFTALTFGYSLVFCLALMGLKQSNHYVVAPLDIRHAWYALLNRKNLLRIYHISFALEFFYVVMIIYTPLYLLVVGFDWLQIGKLFTLMLLPFVLLQYPLGVMADKRFGEKELLIIGLLILAGTTFFMGITQSTSLWIWAGVLFLTRIGAATIEILRDSYFYKQVSAEEANTISFFRTARPVANILSALVALVMLSFFPLSSLFFFVAVVAFSALISGWQLTDTESEYDRYVKNVQ